MVTSIFSYSDDNQHEDILVNEKARIRRMASLYKAAAMHSVTDSPVVITFKSKGAEQCVKTSVMAAGSTSVLCTNGQNLPVRCIMNIEFI